MIDQVVVSEDLLYVDDLHVGRRFKSGTMRSTSDRLRSSPVHSTRRDSTSTKRPHGGQSLGASSQAAGTRQQSPCVFKSRAAYRSPAVSWASREKSRGRRQRGPAMCFRSKARSWKSYRRGGGLTAERSRCGAKPATSAAKSCRRRRSSCSSHAARRSTARFRRPTEVCDDAGQRPSIARRDRPVRARGAHMID
jgi:hypothetical protein